MAFVQGIVQGFLQIFSQGFLKWFHHGFTGNFPIDVSRSYCRDSLRHSFGNSQEILPRIYVYIPLTRNLIYIEDSIFNRRHFSKKVSVRNYRTKWHWCYLYHWYIVPWHVDIPCLLLFVVGFVLELLPLGFFLRFFQVFFKESLQEFMPAFLQNSFKDSYRFLPMDYCFRDLSRDLFFFS